MEYLNALYQELLGDYMAHQRTRTKAERIRTLITNLSEFLDDKRLCLDATFGIATVRVPGLTRGYFINVVRRTWMTERDDHGIEWIRIDRPKHR